jgi:hypothetical protein
MSSFLDIAAMSGFPDIVAMSGFLDKVQVFRKEPNQQGRRGGAPSWLRRAGLKNLQLRWVVVG